MDPNKDMHNLLQLVVHAMNLLLDLYEAPVRGQDGQAVHLDSVIYDQLNSVLPKYCGAA